MLVRPTGHTRGNPAAREPGGRRAARGGWGGGGAGGRDRAPARPSPVWPFPPLAGLKSPPPSRRKRSHQARPARPRAQLNPQLSAGLHCRLLGKWGERGRRKKQQIDLKACVPPGSALRFAECGTRHRWEVPLCVRSPCPNLHPEVPQEECRHPSLSPPAHTRAPPTLGQTQRRAWQPGEQLGPSGPEFRGPGTSAWSGRKGDGP